MNKKKRKFYGFGHSWELFYFSLQTMSMRTRVQFHKRPEKWSNTIICIGKERY